MWGDDMDWKRFTKSVLMCSGLSLTAPGCAVMDALVSSPAGHGAADNSPERLTAIGRVFENQGRLAHAESMYRRALKSDPKNTVARERMEFIASLRNERHYNSSSESTERAVAMADSVRRPQEHPQPPKATPTPTKPTVDIAAPIAAAPHPKVAAADAEHIHSRLYEDRGVAA
ncbi:MAG: tetratricopeptide repeat protein, partial [Planctomycetaceae bacterium]|nr:tetratricopeptide repeat protein [Planctomycetaceae bacterium]